MAIVMYFNTYAAVAEIIIWFVIFGILWKKMNDKYGDTGSHKKKQLFYLKRQEEAELRINLADKLCRMNK